MNVKILQKKPRTREDLAKKKNRVKTKFTKNNPEIKIVIGSR